MFEQTGYEFEDYQRGVIAHALEEDEAYKKIHFDAKESVTEMIRQRASGML
jgi:hypothetical protein